MRHSVHTCALRSAAIAITTTVGLLGAPTDAHAGTVTIESGSSFFAFNHPPVTNASGQVAYYKERTLCIVPIGGSCPVNQWIRRGDGESTPITIAAEDGAVAGLGTIILDLTPDDTFSKDLGPRITDSGAVMFHAALTGPFVNSTNNTGIFSGNGGTLGDVAREGTASPTGANYTGFDAMAINNIGEQAFIADLAGASSPEGIFRRQGGAVTVVQSGNAAPVLAPFMDYDLFGNDTATNTRGIAINNNATSSLNQVAFFSLLDAAVGDDEFDTGIFRSSLAGEFFSTALIKRENANTSGGARLFGQPVINENAFTAYYTAFQGAPFSGIILADTNSPAANAQFALVGDTAPGTTRVFDGFGRRPALNNLDWVAFKATTSPSTGTGQSEGIYRVSLGGAGALVAQVFTTTWVHGEGDRFFTGDFDDNVAVNNRNITAFSGETNNAIFGGTDIQDGIYIGFGSGKPALEVVRTGQALDGSTVVSFKANLEPEQGGNTGFNDASQVAYQATLASGKTGIYLYTPPLKAYFTAATSYAWTDPSDWQLNFVPPDDSALFLPTPAIYDVFVGDVAAKLPASPATVSSPSATTTVASLTIGEEGVGPGAFPDITLEVDHITTETDPTLTVNGPLNIFPIGELAISDAGGTAPVVVAAMDSLTNRGQIRLITGGHLGGPAPLHNYGGVLGDGTIDNRLINMSTGEVVVGDSKTMHFTHTGDAHTSDGTIGISIGATLTFDENLLANAGSSTVIESGILNVPADGVSNATGMTNNGSMLLLDSTINGDLRSPLGSSIEVTGTATFNGLVSGAVDFDGPGTPIFNGGYTPGDSVAAVTFAGAVVLGPANVLTIEVRAPKPPDSAPTAGDDNDLMTISGSVELNGTLGIDLLKPDKRPNLGTEYTVMRFATRTIAAVPTMFSDIVDALIDTDFALAPRFTDTHLVLRASIPGDTNFDNTVSVADLSTFALNFGTTPGFYHDAMGKNSWELGDFNVDGAITVADLSLLALNFGFSLALDGTVTPAAGLSLDAVAALAGIDLAAIAVPEPAVGLVILCGAVGMIGRRSSDPRRA